MFFRCFLYYFLFLLFVVVCFCFFFFSSRRRHTRSLCDWSSDVCSSDLTCTRTRPSASSREGSGPVSERGTKPSGSARPRIASRLLPETLSSIWVSSVSRSEERRVGKEWRSGGSPYR